MAHHGPPCGHPILGTCTGCGGANQNPIPPRFKVRRDDKYGDMAEAIYSDAILTTTCARCDAPLEVTDATVDAVGKAHEERCFVVGDWVRWEVDDNRWYDGEVVGLFIGGVPAIKVGASCGIMSATIGSVVQPPRYPCAIRKDVRRIPRPETQRQTFAPGDVAEWRLDGLTWERVTVVRAYPGDKFEVEHHRTVERWQVHRSELRRVAREEQAVDPLDVKYDDVTLRWLIQQDTENARHDRLTMTGVSAWKFTPIQRAAVSAHWSAELRSRVAASSERERLAVVAPDLELETANCKDAE